MLNAVDCSCGFIFWISQTCLTREESVSSLKDRDLDGHLV